MLFFYARRFLECIGLEQPTVAVFEDIHWAQSSELDLLQYLARHLRDAPVILVAAARPELLDLHPTWGAGLTAQTTIPLDPLRTEDAETLARQLVGEVAQRPSTSPTSPKLPVATRSSWRSSQRRWLSSARVADFR